MASLAGIPAQYNKKSSAVKRIMQEARELVREPSTDFAANPLETDIFEWHFTIRGPEETEFEGGLYHGRILLPNNYPFAPPSLMFLTPNGRFELHKKVCLSITGYHPEYWQPAWGIRTVLVAVMGFLPTQSKGAIGGLDTSVEARKSLAIKSKSWMCQTCHLDMVTILPDVAPENVIKASLKADEMPPEFSFGYEADKKKAAEDDAQGSSNGTGGIRPSSQPVGDKKMEMETKDFSATAPSSPTRTAASSPRTAAGSPGLAAAEVRALKTNDSSPATTTPITAPPSTDSSKEQESVSATSSPLPATSTFRSAHYNPAQPQPTNPPTRPHQAQQTQQIHRVNSSPIWLDILIIGFGGVLVAILFRRFFM
ncbi:Ubiquitin-conjugating enzyme E2 J1 [Linnemannia gamsii]|uniref:Ubiquitin-conjugating enzyme E2 J1 n=1 Tax=Linnemannia gamsii TaxID=64522 RepID=A0ABQ7K144_9FUNG|nr:Ubiquitin-conjugating enzyme E2 J1 [Linnemannia gamsii]